MSRRALARMIAWTVIVVSVVVVVGVWGLLIAVLGSWAGWWPL